MEESPGGLESGSLLQEVLQATRSNGGGGVGGGVLHLTFFEVWQDGDGEGDSDHVDVDESFRRLASVYHGMLARLGLGSGSSSVTGASTACRTYPWWSGGFGQGDSGGAGSGVGPLMGSLGLAVVEGRPCLRARVEYGPSVADEWCATAWAVTATDFSTSPLSLSSEQRLAMEAWDETDGQFLLVEAAHHLPDWVDRHVPCRRRVWIVDGRLHLVPPFFSDDSDAEDDGELNLREALRRLRRGIQAMETDHKASSTLASEAVQQCLRKRMAPFLRTPPPLLSSSNSTTRIQEKDVWKDLVHRAAVVLPLSLAKLIERRPDSVTLAVDAHVRLRSQAFSSSSSPMQLQFPMESLVVVTVRFSRVGFAALLSYPSLSKSKSSPELARMAQKCRRQPHLRNAVDVGKRLVHGFELWCHHQKQQEQREPNSSVSASSSVTMETKVRSLVELHQSCKGGESKRGQWIEDAWKAGPAVTNPDVREAMESLLRCPLFGHDDKRRLTSPRHLWSVIRSGGQFGNAQPKGKGKGKALDDDDDVVARHPYPLPHEVDDDAWLSVDSATDFDRLLADTAAAVSSTAGVGNTNDNVNVNVKNEKNNDVNVADAVLKGVVGLVERGTSGVEGIDDLHRYFSDDDDSENENDSDDQGVVDETMVDLMGAMDDQLTLDGGNDIKGNGDADDTFVAQKQMLENLFESLCGEEEAGIIGPTSTLLRQIVESTAATKTTDAPSIPTKSIT